MNFHFTVKSLNRYSDEELIKLIADDDENAFEALFDRYWETAYSVACSKMKSKEAAEEIVHDLFLNFWQRRHTLQVESFKSYLHVAIKYKVITYINHELSKNKYFADYQNQLQLKPEGPLDSIAYKELQKALEDGMKTLPEKTQEVFRLSRLEGRTIAEIANQLNVSEKAIEYHITRSRKELRVYLKDFLVVFVCVNVLVC